MPAKFVKQATIGSGRFSQQYFVDQFNFDTKSLLPSNFDIVTPSGPVQNTPWFLTSVKATDTQGNVDFGQILSFQISVSKPQAQCNAAATAYLIPGRVLIYVPSTGQVIFYPSKNSFTAPFTSIPGNPSLFEHFNDIVPTVISNGGQIQVWMEQDYNSGSINAPGSVVNIAIFNFEIGALKKFAHLE